jgi:hypothetical protein
VAVLGLFILTSVPVMAQAGATVDLGARLGTDLGDVDREFFGVDVRIGLPALPVTVNPTFDYYGGGNDFYQLSGNALLNLNTASLPNVTPYVGAGLGIAHASNNTDIGINLLGGASISAGPVNPFAQIQLTLLGDVDIIAISIGALFRISG